MCHNQYGTNPKASQPHQSNFGSRLPALVKRNGYEGHVLASACLTGTRSPKNPGPGAVAHMSLHLNQQCQRTADRLSRTTIVPRSLLRGTCCPSMSATGSLGPFRRFEAAFPSGEAASKVASRFGQAINDALQAAFRGHGFSCSRTLAQDRGDGGFPGSVPSQSRPDGLVGAAIP